MICTLKGIIENVESYESKNGWGATITMSSVIEKKRSFVKFNTKKKEIAHGLEKRLQEETEITLDLQQNNFGLRFGEVLYVDGEVLA
jgi:hypothetical protein